MSDSVEKQIELIGKLISNKLAAKRLQKSKVAENCEISVNTLNNAIRGNNINMRTFLLIFESMGMTILDVADELRKHYSVPSPSNKLETDEPEFDTDAIKSEVEETNVDQVSWRAGVSPEEVREATKSHV
jgi:NACalpha-BTF3-like transcription factor